MPVSTDDQNTAMQLTALKEGRVQEDIQGRRIIRRDDRTRASRLRAVSRRLRTRVNRRPGAGLAGHGAPGPLSLDAGRGRLR